MAPDDLEPESTHTDPAHALPRARPRQHGLDARGVQQFLDAVEQTSGVELHSLMILRHGQVLVEGWWDPYRPGDAVQLYSLSKSFTSTAVGFAVQEGLLRLDEPVLDVFERFADVVTDERVRELTVEQCLRMATGHHTDTLERSYRADSVEPLRGFFALGLDAEPGSVFCYNNTATYLVGAAVQERSGQLLTEYLRSRLFEPLGIQTPYWQTHPDDRQIGFAGLHLPTEAIARFGQLCLDQGRWRGRAVLPGGWIEQASTPLTDNSAEPNPDWQQGYGYQFWRSRHGYRGDGAFGQFCLVLPEQDAVIAMTAQTELMQTLLDLVWAHLLPAFGPTGTPADPQPDQADVAAGDAAAADEALAARMAALTLPTPGDAVPTDGGGAAGRPLPAQWHSPDVPAGTSALRVGELVWEESGSGPGRITVVQTAPELSYSFSFGPDWHRDSVQVIDRVLRYAAAGGWHRTEDGRSVVVVEIAFLNSPHRLRVEADPADATARVDWVTAPLGRPVPIEVAVPVG